MTRRTLLSLVVVVAIGLGVAIWLVSRPAVLPPADSMPDTVSDMPGMEKKDERPKPQERASTGAPPSAKQDLPGMVTIAPERLQTIGVKYEVVARRSLETVIRTVGRVAVDERRLAKVTIKFHGWIEKLFVSATGDHVHKGQELFTIYSPDLVATQEEYLLALRGSKQLGQSEFPEVARSSKELLEAARSRFHLWDISEEHIRELERTGTVMRTLPIHSPITGTVISKEVLQGTHVEPGEELYMIADLSHIWILADIYEYELSFVKTGQKATVVLSYEPGTTLFARVGFIYPTLDPKTRTAKVRFEVENPHEKLKPDMYANVELRTEVVKALVVPKEAVLDTGLRQVVFLDRGKGVYQSVPVKIGRRAQDWVEVVEGLKEGDQVVTSANFLLDAESKLRSSPNMMGQVGMGDWQMRGAREGTMEGMGKGGVSAPPGREGEKGGMGDMDMKEKK